MQILKTFSCLGLDTGALRYSSHFFLIVSENYELMKHFWYFTQNFVDCRHLELRPINKINLVAKVKFFRLVIQAILMTWQR